MSPPTEPSGPRPVDRRTAVPLWQQVEADLRRRLDSGHFVDAFPGEHALVAQYEVSRHTVREALRRLRADGVVTAQRGRSPRLSRPTITQPLGALYSLFASVEGTGAVQRSVVRTLDVRTDRTAAAALLVDPDTPLFHLERLRLADDEPLALDRVWLEAAGAERLLTLDWTHTALYAELDRWLGIRITGGWETIRATVATTQEADLLGVVRGAPALSIERVSLVDGRPFEWRWTLVRGDRFAVTADFSPAQGYRVEMGSTVR